MDTAELGPVRLEVDAAKPRDRLVVCAPDDPDALRVAASQALVGLGALGYCVQVDATRVGCPSRRRQVMVTAPDRVDVGEVGPSTWPVALEVVGRSVIVEVGSAPTTVDGGPAPMTPRRASDEVGLPLSLTAELVSALSGSEGLRGCLRDGCCDRHEPHTLTVSFTIDASGAVTDVSLDEQHPDTVLRECVRRALEPLRFPEAPPGRVEYPLEIKPPAR